MRSRIAVYNQPLTASVDAASGFTNIFDVDFGLAHQTPILKAAQPDALMLASSIGGIGPQPGDMLQLCAQIEQVAGGGGHYTPATWPIYVLLHVAWGTPKDWGPRVGAATAFTMYAEESIFMPGTQSGAAADFYGAPSGGFVPAGCRWFNLFPRGRLARFGYQVEPGTDPLANFQLNLELWLVTQDGR